MFGNTFYTISVMLVVSCSLVSCDRVTAENSDPIQCGPLNFKKDIHEELSFPDGKFMKYKNYYKYMIYWGIIQFVSDSTLWFLMRAVLIPVIGIFGLVGNIFSITIFRRPEMKSNTNLIILRKLDLNMFMTKLRTLQKLILEHLPTLSACISSFHHCVQAVYCIR